MKNRWMIFAVLGIEMASSVAAGLFAGDFLDRRFGGETPYMTVAGLALGAAGGFILLFQTLKKFSQ